MTPARAARQGRPADGGLTHGRVTHKEHTLGSIDCFESEFMVNIPAHQCRYLVFFAEMNRDSIQSAKDKARKFNHRHLTPALRTGLSDRIKSRILNWDL